MIYRRFIFQKSSIKNKLKQFLLYRSKKNGAAAAWNKRHGELFRQNPDTRVIINPYDEAKHKRIWRQFWKKVPTDTLTICTAISGFANPFIIPEEIYQADIEPTLNRYPRAHFLAHKSYYHKWFQDCGFPVCYLHKLDGVVMDADMNRIDPDDKSSFIDNLPYPLILKPGMDANGGAGILCIQNPEEMQDRLINSDNFVVQEVIHQSGELSKFHPKSVNTVRVYLYRSVMSDEIHIINRVLRTGNGRIVDNVTAGGLVSYIHDSGKLNGIALDKYGVRYTKHPITGVEFRGEIPKMKELNQLALKVARQLHYLRVVGLDLFYDENEEWRMLEVNTSSHSIRFAQYAGQPFFGEFTEEVIEYCKENHWAYSV